MNQRLLELRKALKLNQVNFGAKVNLKQTSISELEKGVRPLTDRVVTDICREYNVNEQWLRQGIGPMFRPKKSIHNIIAENAASLIKSDNIEAQVLMAELSSLPPEALVEAYKFMTNVVKKVAAELEKQQNK